MSQSTPGCEAVTLSLTLDPCRLLLISLAGGLNQHQRAVIDYLEEENRVLREQLGSKRLESAGINRQEAENEKFSRGRSSDPLGPEFCAGRREACSEA